MGPIEVIFLIVIAIFAVIGWVRGYTRELGVTILLLITLFVAEFVERVASEPFRGLIEWIFPGNPALQNAAPALLWSTLLVVVVFVAYQGNLLSFRGTGKSSGLGISSGLLNGYLFAGSLWFFLGRANWPFLNITTSYTEFYHLAWRFLPPNVLDWPYVVALVALMLVLRVAR